MKYYTSNILLLTILIFGNCKNVANNINININDCHITVEKIYDDLMGNRLDKIKNSVYNNCFKIKDTIIYAEGVEWPGLAFYDNVKTNKLIFLIETNWMQSDTITRITITSSEVKFENGISVGNQFKDIIRFVSDSIPTMPDGYLGLTLKNKKSATILLDIENNQSLFYGVNNKDEIPDSIYVESIVLQ